MIFRKVAMERLSSPEQLDQLIQVTNPRGWLALGALGLLLLTAVAWGSFGSIPTEAQGEGLLLRSGGVASVVAPENGQVEDLLVGVGDVIQKGQVVARIRQEELLRQIQDSRTRLATARSQYQELLRITADQRRLRDRGLAQKRRNLQQSVDALEREVELTRERLASERELLKDGLITKQTLLSTEQRLNTVQDQLASARLELNGLELTRIEGEQQLEQAIQSQEAKIRDLESELRERQARLAESSSVVSNRAGRVLELLVDRGAVVGPGTALLSLEVVSEELMAVLFVPATAGKQVQPGMAVRLSPYTVKREEFGSILGRVTWTAEYPSTARGMGRLLNNDALVEKLMQAGPPIQINVALERDPTTPSGFRWSSSRGPNLPIGSGTLARGDIIVRREAPLNLVIPNLREKLGL